MTLGRFGACYSQMRHWGTEETVETEDHAHLSLPSSPETCYKIVIPELSSKYLKSSGTKEYTGILLKYVSRGSLWLVYR